MCSQSRKPKARRPVPKQAKPSKDTPTGPVLIKGPESHKKRPQVPGQSKKTVAGSDKIRQQPETSPPETTYASSRHSEIDSPTARLQGKHTSLDTGSQQTWTLLTRKNLKLFNKMAKNKGRKRVSPSDPLEPDYTPTTHTVSTLSSRFPMKANQNGILESSLSKPPENFEDIRKRYAHSRRTASPTRSVYSEYLDTVQTDANEATIVQEVATQLLKRYGGRGYAKAFNRALTDFPEGVGFNNGLSTPRPDYIEGLRLNEYAPFRVADNIQGAVLYADNPRSITLPHLAGEFKGARKDLYVGELQSAYAGAALVYGRNQALSCLGKPDAPGHAEVSTFATDGTTLKLFANYAAWAEDGSLQYHQYPMRSINLTESHQAFKEGRKVLRNAQDHARELSFDLRDQLKQLWRRRRNSERAPQPVTAGTSKGGKRPVATTRKAEKTTTTKVLTGRVARPARRQLRYNLRSSK